MQVQGTANTPAARTFILFHFRENVKGDNLDIRGIKPDNIFWRIKQMKILLAAINAKYIHSNLAVYSLQAYARENAPELSEEIYIK